MTGLLCVLLVGVGGAAGAVSRFAVTRWCAERLRFALPAGTLAVNLSGSFLLGWMYGGHVGDAFWLLLGTGFMGAYTTFSTFGYESVQLISKRSWGMFCIYVGVSATFGLLLAFAGYRLGLFVNGEVNFK